MKINKVTITGADDYTDVEQLRQLQREFPFVEWGILFSRVMGRNRYPSLDKIKEFINARLNMSAHLCGKYAKDILEKNDFQFVKSLPFCFNRFQLNYNFANNIGNWNLLGVINWLKEMDDYPRFFILQANKSNDFIIKYTTIGANYGFDILYDSSGGRGTEIKSFKKPILNYYTGYAGGIGPDNVAEVCDILTNMEDESAIWIDMESKVRDENDKLDLDKVRKVLEICKKYVYGL